MGSFWQGAAAVLLAVIVGLTLGKQGREVGLLLTMAVCCMVAGLAISYLSPVIAFIRQLRSVSELDSGMLEILLKAVGIGLVGEIAGLICTDAGNGALGKGVQMLSTSVILWLSLPMLEQLIELIQEILGGI